MLLLDDDDRADGDGDFFYGGDYNLPLCMTGFPYLMEYYLCMMVITMVIIMTMEIGNDSISDDYNFTVPALSVRLVFPYFMMILLFFMFVLVMVTMKMFMIMKRMVVVMMTLKIIIIQYTGDDYIFAVPALSVRLVVPPAPIVAGRLYTVDCQVDCIF